MQVVPILAKLQLTKLNAMRESPAQFILVLDQRPGGDPVALEWAKTKARYVLEPALEARNLQWTDADPCFASVADVEAALDDVDDFIDGFDDDAGGGIFEKLLDLLDDPLQQAGLKPLLDAVERIHAIASSAHSSSMEYGAAFALVSLGVSVLEISKSGGKPSLAALTAGLDVGPAKEAAVRQAAASLKTMASSVKLKADAQEAYNSDTSADNDRVELLWRHLRQAEAQYAKDAEKTATACTRAVGELVRSSKIDPEQKRLLKGVVTWIVGLRAIMQGQSLTKEQKGQMIEALTGRELIQRASKNADDGQMLLEALFSLMSDDVDIESFVLLAKQLGANERVIRDLEAAQALTKLFLPILGILKGGGATSKLDLASLANEGGEVALRQIFALFDTDSSGMIDFEEFCQMFKYMGAPLSREQLVSLYSAADATGDGQIVFEEFEQVFMSEVAALQFPTRKRMRLRLRHGARTARQP